MKSDLPKVLHLVGGRPMVLHVIDSAREVGFERQIVIVGHGREKVMRALREHDVEIVVQERQLGTGHAVEMAAPLLVGYEGDLAVLCGDVPLLRPGTLRALWQTHTAGGYAATVLTFDPPDPTGYGRVYRNARGEVERIVEQRDLPPGEAHPTESNSGTYCFHWPRLRPLLSELDPANDQNEIYLTDTIAMLRARGEPVAACLTDDPEEVSGVNDLRQLRALDAAYRRRLREAQSR
jgi:bifunctional UDP-N-acetylglucosamine pyrophosphorylase/glucosamine-1-phosphate N-acetyltransferase